VVKGVSETSVLVGDPTFGLQTYSREEFQEVWNGVVLAVRRAPDNVQAPRFNDDEEWRPWSVASFDDAQGPVSPSALYLHMQELYQITALAPVE
jgi:hypothetical protein